MDNHKSWRNTWILFTEKIITKNSQIYKLQNGIAKLTFVKNIWLKIKDVKYKFHIFFILQISNEGVTWTSKSQEYSADVVMHSKEDQNPVEAFHKLATG